MGKVCVSCGGDVDMPKLPEEEDELCPDCKALEEGGEATEEEE